RASTRASTRRSRPARRHSAVIRIRYRRIRCKGLGQGTETATTRTTLQLFGSTPGRRPRRPTHRWPAEGWIRAEQEIFRKLQGSHRAPLTIFDEDCVCRPKKVQIGCPWEWQFECSLSNWWNG